MNRIMQHAFSLTLICSFLAACASPKEVAVITDRPAAPTLIVSGSGSVDMEPVLPPTTMTGRFDRGKMWTFDNPPVDYFAEAYGLQLDTTWFHRARLGALRFSSSCSASLVSPHGLVMTNHHCARESITEVNKEGEDLIANGFYAQTLDEERRVNDLHVDQLLEITDVTARVRVASRNVRGDNEKVRERNKKSQQIEEEMTKAAANRDSTLRVDVVELYDGGRYAAYTFRRYNDVRLVMAPEKSLGYFGGDADNFTYPRYSLDMSFFRVYDAEGTPMATDDYFRWSTDGSREGDPVFVVGNPGSTSRSGTVPVLAYARDFSIPREIEALRARAEVLEDFLMTLPAEGDHAVVRNLLFSLRNSIKARMGELAGLRDPALMDLRAAADQQARYDISQSDSLQALYGGIFQDLEELQRSKESETARSGAFTFFGTSVGSRILTRSLYGYYHDTLKKRGFSSESDLAEIRKDALALEDLPLSVETALIALRLLDLHKSLGEGDPTFRRLTGGLPVDTVASRLVAATQLADSAGFSRLLDSGYLSSGDVTVEVIEALAPLYFAVREQVQSFSNREALLKGQLAQVQLALHGTQVPPDASFSLRIADGEVKGYAYNGTVAPAYTTFYGLYNHYYSYRTVSADWDLPETWLMSSAAFDPGTPLNLVSTNDITGGNSGSPLLNKDLEVVGLIFDGNIESLPNTFLYTDHTARAISVDSRGILEVLDDVYDADRIVIEILAGRIDATEEEAEQARP